MRLSSAALVLSVLSMPLAHAKIVYKSGNWALDDLSADLAPQNICSMVQVAKIGRTSWRLEITHAKNAVGVTEILLKQTGSVSKTWSATTNSGETLVFADAGTAGTAQLLWQVPQNTSALIAHWDAKKDISMKPADGSRGGFKLFDSGFAQVKAEMIKRCLGNIPLVDAVFESAFLKNSSPIDPNALVTETVAELRSLFDQGHQTFLSMGANSRELRSLQDRFAAPLDEARTLESNIAQLTNTTIPGIQQSIINNEALEVNSKNELQRLSALIPGQQTAVANAEILQKRTYDAIAPYLNEHAAIENEIETASSQINRGEYRLSEIDNSLSYASNQLRSLNNELPQVNSTLRRNQDGLRQAENEERRAESDYRSFNPSSELRQRLQRDSSYQSASRDLERAKRESQRSHSEWKRAVADRDNKERAVNACRARPEANCRAEEGAWKLAVVTADRAESEYRRYDGQISSLRSSVRNAEQRAQREVESIRNQLGNRLVEFQRRTREFELAVRQGEQRSREISNDISRFDNQISSLNRERPLIVDQISRGRSDLSRANSALVSFEQRVGWHAKLAAYQNADEALNARESELNSSVRGKANAERNIQTAQAQRPILAQDLVVKQTQLTAASSRLVEVRASLVTFEVEKQKLIDQGMTLRGQFDSLSAQFEAKLP